MKRRHVEGERFNARETLRMLGIPIGADFHTLNSSTVDALIAEADRARYQKPTNANGSRGRYFHARLQRLAQKKDS